MDFASAIPGVRGAHSPADVVARARLNLGHERKAEAEAHRRKQQDPETQTRLGELKQLETQGCLPQGDADQTDRIGEPGNQRRHRKQREHHDPLTEPEDQQRTLDLHSGDQRTAQGDAADERHQHHRERKCRGAEGESDDPTEENLVPHRREPAECQGKEGAPILQGSVGRRRFRATGLAVFRWALLGPRALFFLGHGPDQRSGGEVQQRCEYQRGRDAHQGEREEARQPCAHDGTEAVQRVEPTDLAAGLRDVGNHMARQQRQGSAHQDRGQ